MKLSLILIFTLFQLVSLLAQAPRETRAVWISTNYRLDWPPPTFDEKVQKKSMLEILDNIEKKNFNTIYIQVRSNGTLLYKSSIEPFSPYFTGKIDVMGSYDPLEFIVAEAHKRGLEIHAWINTMRCFNSSDITILEHPKHLCKSHPYWLYKKNEENGSTSLWLNPGLPAARDHLINVIDELVQNYDIDGVQLDFIRYPKEPINDAEAYAVYGNDKNINDWRRENINKFIRSLSIKLKATNPLLKLGVTPIGIYENIPNARGLEGRNDVFQDSREWLANGYIDYIVPQIYWNIDDNPRFSDLVKDWNDNSHGKNVIIGIAAYKESVIKELDEEIKISRSNNSSGVSFFRYSHIKDFEITEFKEKVFPAKIPWLVHEGKLPGITAQISEISEENSFSLRWKLNKEKHKNVKYLALYEVKNRNDINLLKILPSNATSVNMLISSPNKVVYSYLVKTLDKLWNESSTENIVSYKVPKLKNFSDDLAKFNKPLITKIGDTYFLLLSSNNHDQLILKTTNDFEKPLPYSSHKIHPGINSIKIDSNILNYSKIDLVFQNSKRVVKLKR